MAASREKSIRNNYYSTHLIYLLRHSNRIHFLTDLAAGLDNLGIGGVADVDEADLVVLAVEAAGKGLVAELEPVRAHDNRIFY